MIIHPPLRDTDAHGMGHYHASRGNRLHNGVDVACYPGSIVCAIDSGTVTKIGRPYFIRNPKDRKDTLKNQLRYVQVTTVTGLDYRYFYIDPMVEQGNTVIQGDYLGRVQDLFAIYGQDMTNHCHVEIKRDGDFIDPTPFVLTPT